MLYDLWLLTLWQGREIVKCMNHWYLWHFGIPTDFLSSWGRPPSYEPIHNGMMNLAIGALPRIAFSLFCDLITVEVWSTWKAVCYFKKRPLKLMNDTRNCAQKKPKKSCYPRNFMTPHCVHKLTMFFSPVLWENHCDTDLFDQKGKRRGSNAVKLYRFVENHTGDLVVYFRCSHQSINKWCVYIRLIGTSFISISSRQIVP